MRSKSAPDAAKAFEKMIEKMQPQKLWSDKGTKFKKKKSKILAIGEESQHIQLPVKQSQRLQRETFAPSK